MESDSSSLSVSVSPLEETPSPVSTRQGARRRHGGTVEYDETDDTSEALDARARATDGLEEDNRDELDGPVDVPPASPAADLVPGEGVLYSTGKGARAATDTFCSVGLIDDLVDEDGGESSPVKELLQRLCERITPSPSHHAIADAPQTVREWRRGTLVGRVLSKQLPRSWADRVTTDRIVVLSPNPLARHELHMLRQRLGLAECASASPMEEMHHNAGPAPRRLDTEFAGALRSPVHSPTERVAYRSRKTVLGESRGLLSPKREEEPSYKGRTDVADGATSHHDEESGREAEVPSRGISLDLLIQPRRLARGTRSRQREPLPPLPLVVCWERDIHPLPHWKSPNDVASYACADGEAAEAALLWTLDTHMESGGDASFCRIHDLPTALEPTPLNSTAATWVSCRPQSGPRNRDVRAQWAEFLGQRMESVLKQQHCPTAMTLFFHRSHGIDDSSGPSPLLSGVLALAAGNAPRFGALVELLSMFGYLDGTGFDISCVCEAGRPCFTDEHVQLRLIATARWSAPPCVQSLRRIPSEMRKDMEAANRRAQQSGRQTAWSLSAFLDAAMQQPASEGLATQLIRCLRTLGLTDGDVSSFAKTLVGLGCLAALVSQSGDAMQRAADTSDITPTQLPGSQRWFVSEAEELLGCRLGGCSLPDVLASLYAYMGKRLLLASRMGEAAAAQAVTVRLVQLPQRGQDTEDDFVTDLCHDAVCAETFATGLARSIAADAQVEGVWRGALRKEFGGGALGTEGLESASSPSTLVRLAEAAQASVETLITDTSVPPRLAEMLPRAFVHFCKRVVRDIPRASAQITKDARAIRVQRLNGSWATYPLSSIFTPLKTFVTVAASPLFRSESANGLIRDWVRTGAAEGMTEVFVNMPFVNAREPFHRGHHMSVVEITPHDMDTRSTNLELVLSLFRLTTCATSVRVPINAFCQRHLSLAVRHYCCTRTMRGVENPIFVAPTSFRRDLYVAFLQLMAMARYRDACSLCLKEFPFANGFTLGVSNVFLRQSDVLRLRSMGEALQRAALCRIQECGRGMLARREVGSVLLIHHRRASRQAAVEARVSTAGPAFMARDKDQMSLVERTSQHATSCVNMAQRRVTSAMNRLSSEWESTSHIAEQELTCAVHEIGDFESALLAAERRSRNDIEAVRALLSAEWRRQTAQMLPSGPQLQDTRAERRPSTHRGPRARYGLPPPPDVTGVSGREAAERVANYRATQAAAIKRHLYQEEERQRWAEKLVGHHLKGLRTRQEAIESEQLTAQHLQRQQERFSEYAERRNTRAEWEKRVLALGAGEAPRSSDDVKDLGMVPPPAEESTLMARKPHSYYLDRDGLLRTGSRRPHQDTRTTDTSVFTDEAIFEAQREQLSLWEDE